MIFSGNVQVIIYHKVDQPLFGWLTAPSKRLLPSLLPPPGCDQFYSGMGTQQRRQDPDQFVVEWEPGREGRTQIIL